MGLINWKQQLEDIQAEHRQNEAERERELKKSREHVNAIYGILEDNNVDIDEVYERLDEIEYSLSEVLWKYNNIRDN